MLLITTELAGFVALPGLVHASNLTFGNAINLSSDLASSGTPRMAAAGKNVYVVWVDNTSGNSDILFRASNNHGTSFGQVIKLSTTVNRDDDKPQIAAVESNVSVVWQ